MTTKPPPFAHQREIMPTLAATSAWGLFWETGCAKTRPTIEDVCRAFREGVVDSLLVVGTGEAAPNWYADEIPEWMDPDVLKSAAMHLWSSAKASTKHHQRAVQRVLTWGRGLRILIMSYDALMTDRGRDAAWELLRGGRCYMVIDECADIKNPDAKRSVRVVRAGQHAKIRRALEGTPVTQGPFDVYTPVQFLDPGFWSRHGFSSFAAFKNHFGSFVTMQQGPRGAQAMGAHQTQLISDSEHIVTPRPQVRRADGGVRDVEPRADNKYLYQDGDLVRLAPVLRMDGTTELRRIPSTGEVAWRPGDAPRYEVTKGFRRLDQLNAMLKEISSRRLKEDCLDLPPKLYEKIRFELAPEQRRMYDEMSRQMLTWINEGAACEECGGSGRSFFYIGDERLPCECVACSGLGRVMLRTASATMALTRDLRLQQIACGYVPVDDFRLDGEGEPPEPLHIIPGPNPRLEAARRLMERLPRKGILWGQYRFDIDLLMAAARELGRTPVQYDGRIGQEERLHNKNEFQHGSADLIVASSAMSRSVTVHAAWWMAYYTNSPKLRFRKQSEDRVHRAGLEHPVTIYDLIAVGTVDERQLERLREKNEVAGIVNGDRRREWI